MKGIQALPFLGHYTPDMVSLGGDRAGLEQSKIKEGEWIAKLGIQAGIHIPGLQVINGKRVAVLKEVKQGRGRKKGGLRLRVRGVSAAASRLLQKLGPLTCKLANLRTC